jgi:hypothetical protein
LAAQCAYELTAIELCERDRQAASVAPQDTVSQTPLPTHPLIEHDS